MRLARDEPVLLQLGSQRVIGNADLSKQYTSLLTLLGWLVLFQVVAYAVESRGAEIALAKLRGQSPWWTLRFGLGVLRHLATEGRQYDVVHMASFPYFSVLAAAAARRRR